MRALSWRQRWGQGCPTVISCLQSRGSVRQKNIKAQNRGRLAEKRTIPLPPSRTPKKEPPTLFSHSDNHKEVEKINRHHPHVKQEEDLHISIMKRRYAALFSFLSLSLSHSQNGDLTSFLSNLHQSRQLGMPETQNRCEFKRNSLEVGLGAEGTREPIGSGGGKGVSEGI
uniref:Uncharacterized protein n=1 Tax=Naja naja TaxID=35670 RepID=A0A8C7E2W6_NAJNA